MSRLRHDGRGLMMVPGELILSKYAVESMRNDAGHFGPCRHLSTASNDGVKSNAVEHCDSAALSVTEVSIPPVLDGKKRNRHAC